LPELRQIMIVRIDEDSNVAETRNTLYPLGEASRDYQTWQQERATSEAAQP
jgi:hypothetical protein